MTDKTSAEQQVAAGEESSKSPVSPTGGVVNAWSKKPKIQADANSTAIVQPVATPPHKSQQNQGGDRSNNGNLGAGGRKSVGGRGSGGRQSISRSDSSGSTGSQQQQMHPRQQIPKHLQQYANMASGSGQMQNRRNVSFGPSASSDDQQSHQMTGAHKSTSLQFGSISTGGAPPPPSVSSDKQPQPQQPLPKFKSGGGQQFDAIQRVRSAPPEVIQDEKQQQQQQQQQQFKKFQHQQPQGVPIPMGMVAMNPSAQSFRPVQFPQGAPAGAVPYFYPQGPGGAPAYAISYGPPPGQFGPGPAMRPPMIGHGGAPYPPNFIPVVLPPQSMPPPQSQQQQQQIPSTPQSQQQQQMMMQSKNTPPSQIPPVNGATDGSTPTKAAFKLPEPRKKTVLKIVNPDTKEEVKLEEFKVESTNAPTASQDQLNSTPSAATEPESQEAPAPVSVPVPPAGDKKKRRSSSRSRSPEKSQASPVKSNAGQPSRDPSPSRKAASPTPPPPVAAAAAAPPPQIKEESIVTIPETTETPPTPQKEGLLQQKIRYTVDFLLKFRPICIDRPSDLPKMEAIVGEDVSNSTATSSGGGGYHHGHGGGYHGHGGGYPRESMGGGGPGGRRSSRKYNDRMSGGDHPMMAQGGGSSKQRTSEGPMMMRGGKSSGGGRQSSGGAMSKMSGGGGGGGGGGRRASGRMSGAGGGRYSSGNQQQQQQYQQPFEELQKSDNRWKPTKERTRDELDAIEVLQGKIRSWLNKLTVEMFDQITAEIRKLPIENYEELNLLARLIFEKAVEETKFSGMYANLCLDLYTTLPNFNEEVEEQLKEQFNTTDRSFIDKRQLFRRILLQICQKEFESKSEWTQTQQQLDEQQAMDQMTAEELEVHIAETARRKKLKRRTLGNIRFIGELYKLGLLNEKIMHACFKHLFRDLKSPEEEEMESACDLMETVGEKLDADHQRAIMDSYFQHLQSLSVSPVLQSRIRFKIKDVMELRQRDWQARERQQRLNMGPMRIDELKREFERQQQLEQQQRSSESGGGGRSKSAAANWTMQQKRGGSGGQQQRVEILKRNSNRRSGSSSGASSANSSHQQESATNSQSTSAAMSKSSSVSSDINKRSSGAANTPSSTSGGNAKKSSSQAARDSVASAASGGGAKDQPSGNIFDALIGANGHEEEEEEEIEEVEEIEAPEEGQEGFVEPERIANYEKKEMDDFIEKQLSKEFASLAIASSPESFDDAFRLFCRVRAYAKEDQDRPVITLRALERLLVDTASEAFKQLTNEESDRKVQCFADTVARVFRHELVPVQDLLEFFERQILEMPDMVIDIPGLDAALGTAMAHLCVVGHLGLQFCADCIDRIVEDFGDFTPRLRPRTNDVDPPCVARFFGHLLRSMDRHFGRQTLQSVYLQYYQVDSVEDVTVEMLRKPWWGADDEKLKSIPTECIVKWLNDFGIHEAAAPSI